MFGLFNTFEPSTCCNIDQSKKVTHLHWPERISKYDREDYSKYIPIKLDLFIERIYLSPSSQDWHIEYEQRNYKSTLYSLH